MSDLPLSNGTTSIRLSGKDKDSESLFETYAAIPVAGDPMTSASVEWYGRGPRRCAAGEDDDPSGRQ